jgi:flagellar capping protein FliD
MKKRLEFLRNERQQKQAELERLEQRTNSTGGSALLHAILGDGVETHMLEMQQMKARAEDISSQIRRLDFEIDTLKTDMRKREADPITQYYRTRQCSSCGKDISQFPADALHCPYCGSKL